MGYVYSPEGKLLATQQPNNPNIVTWNNFATCGSFRELAGTLYRETFWLVADQLGTPRMIVNKSGSFVSVKRHDYLPFGEELSAGTGGRTWGQGYTGDSVRQRFTGYEADGETGLNFAQARYQSSTQGRFISVDPLGASASTDNPQTFNRYSYVLNKPISLIDQSGLMYGEPDTYLVDGSSSMGSGIALNLLRSGAGVLGPISTTRRSQGDYIGGFETYRAVGNYAGWFNRHGISVDITTMLTLDGYGSWNGNGWHYGIFGHSFPTEGESVSNAARDVFCFPCTYANNAKRGHNSLNLSIYNYTVGTMHDDESDGDFVLVGFNGGIPAIGSLSFTQAEGPVRPGLWVAGQVAAGGPGYTASANVLHARSTFSREWNVSTPTVNGSVFLVIPQNRNLGASYPNNWSGVMDRKWNPGPGPGH